MANETKKPSSFTADDVRAIVLADNQDLARELQCGVCLSIADDIINMPTKCEHVFCRSCITASMDSKKQCPTCRKKFTSNKLVSSHVANALVRKLSVRCKYDDCKKTFALGKLVDGVPSHYAECKFHMGACSKCSEQVNLTKMKHHMEKECIHRKITCELCRDEFGVTEIKKHQDAQSGCAGFVPCSNGCRNKNDSLVHSCECAWLLTCDVDTDLDQG